MTPPIINRPGYISELYMLSVMQYMYWFRQFHCKATLPALIMQGVPLYGSPKMHSLKEFKNQVFQPTSSEAISLKKAPLPPN